MEDGRNLNIKDSWKALKDMEKIGLKSKKLLKLEAWHKLEVMLKRFFSIKIKMVSTNHLMVKILIKFSIKTPVMKIQIWFKIFQKLKRCNVWNLMQNVKMYWDRYFRCVIKVAIGRRTTILLKFLQLFNKIEYNKFVNCLQKMSYFLIYKIREIPVILWNV